MPKKTQRRRKRTSYPKGYRRVSDKTLAADRKKRPGKFPASLIRRKVENAEKRGGGRKKKTQLDLF